MRRVVFLLFCFLWLAFPVMASSGVSSAGSQTEVNADGTCRVTLTLQLQLESAEAELRFPLPASARDITVNGGTVSAPSDGTARQADISGIASGAGTYTLVIRYTLPDIVTVNKSGALRLQLELLSGFVYPVEHLQATVTLPGTVEE